MFKAAGLDSVVSCPCIRPTRLLWAPRAVRSFSATVRVSAYVPRKPSRSRGKQHERHECSQPWACSDKLRRFNRLENAQLDGLERAEQDFLPKPDRVYQRKEGDGFQIRRCARTSVTCAWRVAKKDLFSELVQATYQGEKKKEHWTDGMGRLRRDIMLEQDFHAKLHEDLLQKIMQHRGVQRGMPVYDTTYNAVRSRKDLFIKTPRPIRSLQYLLPAVQSILDFGPLKRRRELEPGNKVAVRPSSLLVLCPTLGHAQEVQDMCTTLIHGYKIGLGVGSLSVPTQKLISVVRSRGFNVIASTPEFITQWLGLHKAKAALDEALQDMQTLVVDGEASSLRDGEFRELMQGIMYDASLPADTQRIIVSDTFDPERDGSLAKMVLRDDYELHAESRLEEIQAMQIARDNAKKKGKGKRSPKEIRKGEAGLRQSQREVLGCRWAL